MKESSYYKVCFEKKNLARGKSKFPYFAGGVNEYLP
jgi:hypothetical protein